MPILALVLAGGCAYSVEDWLTDVAETTCACTVPNEQDACVEDELAALESASWWEACRDEPAPVDRADVRAWARDYEAACDRPYPGPPEPDDPDWYASCSP